MKPSNSLGDSEQTLSFCVPHVLLEITSVPLQLSCALVCCPLKLLLGEGCVLCCVWLLSRVRLFVTPWTVLRQAPLSKGLLQARILEWAAMPPTHILYHLSLYGSRKGFSTVKSTNI